MSERNRSPARSPLVCPHRSGWAPRLLPGVFDCADGRELRARIPGNARARLSPGESSTGVGLNAEFPRLPLGYLP
jgi:hypothetical protein